MSRLGLAVLFFLSLVLALGLQLLLLPEMLSHVAPLWLALVLAYWSVYGPNYPVLLLAFFFGLLNDVAAATPLGQHALGLVLVAYTCTNLRVSIGRFTMLQQALSLIPMLMLYSLLLFWLDGMARHPSDALARFLPAVTSALFWPLICMLLDALGSRNELR